MNTPPAASPAKWSQPLIAKHAAVGAAFATLCSAALAQIAANAPGVARGDDPEYLHQLRVGIRRLLSAMRAFRPLLRRKRADAVARPLRAMMRVFGAARDWDVLCFTLARAKASKSLVARAHEQRSTVAGAARELASSRTFESAQSRVLRWLKSDPWRSHAAPNDPLLGYARRSLERAHRRLHKRARRIDWRDPARRHALRIALKRLRYGCDFFAACFPHQAVRPFVARLARLQDSLGELNDIAVARALLDELHADTAHVQRFLARRERELIALLAKDWAALERQRPYWRPQPAPRARRRIPRASATRA